jgi:formylmethanofuran dehydrogenase subunit E
MGYRMARVAMESLASIRAADEELVAIVENDARVVDALQCITGGTFGKDNLLFRDYGKHVYTIYARSTRQGVRVHFHGEGIPDELQDARDAFALWVLTAPSDQMLSLERVSIPEPEPARIMDSIPCAFCGEGVMESRIRQWHGRPAL